MSASGPPTARGLIGFLDALRDGVMVVGWASDPTDPAVRPTIRLMRGVEVLAECGTDATRDDGNPGFRLVSPTPLTPQDFLEGRVRIRAMLPGRQVATTLAMTRRMRAALEAAAGWEPTTELPGAQAAPAQPAPAQPVRTQSAPAQAVAAASPSRAVPPRPPPSATRGQPVEAARPMPVEPPPPPPPPAPIAPPAPPRPAQPAVPPVRVPIAQRPPESPQPPSPPALRAAAAPVVEPPIARPAPAPAAELRVPPPRAPLVLPPAPRAAAPGWVPAAPAQAAAPPLAAAITPPPSPAIIVAPKTDLPPPLDAMFRLAEPLGAAGITVLHLLVPRRVTVIGGLPLVSLTPSEAAAAAWPALARGWLPLRHAFARSPQPTALWRMDGVRLSVEGGLALMETLLAALRACRPDAAEALGRVATLLGRAELTALPRREVPQTADAMPESEFLGVSVRETEAALDGGDLFYDTPPPRPIGEPVPGLEAWSSAGAPLPWRVLLLTTEGLGGSAGPACPGWWLRHLAVECVFSEGLMSARPASVIEARPDLVLTLALEPA